MRGDFRLQAGHQLVKVGLEGRVQVFPRRIKEIFLRIRWDRQCKAVSLFKQLSDTLLNLILPESV